MSPSWVPVSLRKRSAAMAERGKRSSMGERSMRSTTSVRITRCGAPSSAVVTTVSNTDAAVYRSLTAEGTWLSRVSRKRVPMAMPSAP